MSTINLFFRWQTIFFLAISLIVGVIVKKYNRDVADVTEIEKCPACFGVSLCRDIDRKKILFSYADFNSFFNNLLGIKNVFHGVYENKRVIMKKLAHDDELKIFDDLVCTNDELAELCYANNDRSMKDVDFRRLISTELANAKFDDPNVKIRLCPTVDRIDELLGIERQRDSAKDENYYKYRWSLIKMNPEPIILQLLKPEDGWPTPKYLGECGRLVIEEYVGLPLSAFINEPWLKRAEIASSLLDAAYKFTFRNSKFAFYLTDVSMENIAVNHENKAVFVDLENIIVVDKDPPSKITTNMHSWNKTHISESHNDCHDCFIFSPNDICSHEISDHNYFAICQHILGQDAQKNIQGLGFLHGQPDDILKDDPMITNLIKKCSNPDTPNSRITFGIELQKVLNSIINNKKRQ